MEFHIFFIPSLAFFSCGLVEDEVHALLPASERELGFDTLVHPIRLMVFNRCWSCDSTLSC